VEFVQKPTALANELVLDMGAELVAKVKAAAQVPMGRLPIPAPAPPPAPPAGTGARRDLYDVVVLGISTGGPQALKQLIPQLPADFPLPLAIVMHMPVGYTELYARGLDELSPLQVIEAAEGSALRPGAVLIAPAGRHLTLRRQSDGAVLAHLDAKPFDSIHRPSVDVLFQSAAEAYGQRALGVIMTGMGADGQHGAAWIKARGGTIWTEAEESCVVYGMPRAAVEAGLSDRQVPLAQMAQALREVA
jgi:two-component system chemotaxis response regulator CheB